MSDLSWPLSLPAEGRAVDLVCLGHALVDRLAEAGPEVVAAAGLEVGAMTLVSGAEAAEIEAAHRGWREVAGGSAANTAVGAASLGATVAFAGSIGPDEAGRRYVADLEAAGVRCVAHETTTGAPTGVCHVFVGPDGDRSMATCLGAAGELAPPAVHEVGVAAARVVYVEGYLLDAPLASDAVEAAVEAARAAGTLVALSLSDPFVVARHRDRILELLGSGDLGLLFGNEEETTELAGEADLDDALGRLVREGLVVVATRGAFGSVVAAPAGRVAAPAAPVAEVVDTTGAGDLFAAGVLYGLVSGRSPAASLSLGSLSAAEVIGHLGARPLTSLAALAAGA